MTAEFDLSFGLHPAGKILLLGTVAAALAEIRRLSTNGAGGTVFFTMGIYALGAFFDDIAALLMGWSYDDVVPEDTNQAFFDVFWVVLLALVGLARWRLRHSRLRRVIDGFWLACVAYQFAIVAFDSRPVGAAGAALVILATILLGQRVWLVSRGAALMLVPLAVFLAYRLTTFL